MAAGLGANGGEGFQFGAVLLHVRHAGAGELADGVAANVDVANQLVDQVVGALQGRGAVGPHGLQRTRVHLLEAEGQGAVHGAALHGLAGQEQGGGAGGAVVVDVDHRDAGHADAVHGLLAAGRIAIDVTGVSLLDIGKLQAGIGQRQADRLLAHHVVGLAGARLGELDHADASDEYLVAHFISPGEFGRVTTGAKSVRA
ncbi:hypothetical protein D3C78_938700 [compost metagenome]